MKKLVILLAFISILTSCSKDESDKAEIIGLNITAFSSESLILQDISIDSENGKVYIHLNNDLTDFIFPIALTTDIKLSSGAKTSSIINDELSFSNADEVKEINIKAEDGTIKKWYVYLFHKQLQNSDFEDWYTNVGMNGLDYLEIGNAAVESMWATANMGTSLYKHYGSQPLIEDSKTYAKIVTVDSMSVPIAAGTLFTGRFDIAGAIANPMDPEKATKFGVPFIFRPVSFKVKFKYQAGEKFLQGTFIDPDDLFGGYTTEILNEEDQCSIFSYLEYRNGNTNIEIARAELFSTSTDDVIGEKTVDYVYTSNQIPTHITVVFSSSKDGHYWRGAEGSTLIIEEFELIYE